MAAAAEILQHVKSEVEFNLPRSLRIAATEHGKSPWAQVREIWRLRFGPGKLRPDEYYYYGLYERRFALEDQLRFLGRATQDGIYRACNALEWWLIAHDKLVFYRLLRGQGLPVPETRAVYHRGRRFGGAAALTSRRRSRPISAAA